MNLLGLNRLVIATKKGFTYTFPLREIQVVLAQCFWAGHLLGLALCVCFQQPSQSRSVAQSPPSLVVRCPVHTASVWVTDGARVAVSEYTDHESEILRYGPLKCFQSYELVQRCTILTQPILMKPLEYGCHAVPYSDPILCPELPLKWPHGTHEAPG